MIPLTCARANTGLQANGTWVPEVQACMRVHTHVALLNNAVMLGSEIFFLLLMAGGIYYYNSGRRALKIMFREVRDHRSRVVPCVWTDLPVMAGPVVAYLCRTAADRRSCKRAYSLLWASRC